MEPRHLSPIRLHSQNALYGKDTSGFPGYPQLYYNYLKF